MCDRCGDPECDREGPDMWDLADLARSRQKEDW